jgi:LysR substrate binding domain
VTVGTSWALRTVITAPAVWRLSTTAFTASVTTPTATPTPAMRSRWCSLDVALTCGPVPEPAGIATEVFCAEPLLVGLRPNHRLASHDLVALSELAHEVLGTVPEALFPAWALTQRQALDTAGIAPPTIELPTPTWQPSAGPTSPASTGSCERHHLPGRLSQSWDHSGRKNARSSPATCSGSSCAMKCPPR